MTYEKKTEVVFLYNPDYQETYNSAVRVMVTNPVDEKYARKMIQDKLKNEFGLYRCEVNKLYDFSNDIKSFQDDKWIFGLSIPAMDYMFNSNAVGNLVSSAKKM